MEHTTKSGKDDAKSDITDDLNMQQGKVNYGKTLYIPC